MLLEEHLDRKWQAGKCFGMLLMCCAVRLHRYGLLCRKLSQLDISRFATITFYSNGKFC